VVFHVVNAKQSAVACFLAAWKLHLVFSRHTRYCARESRLFYISESLIWVHFLRLVPDQLRTKLEKKAIRCIFTGYDEQKKGRRCMDSTTNKAYVSPHVVVDEASW